MNWIQKLIAALVAWLTGANKSADTPQSTPEPEPSRPNTGACSARITAVYTGVKADEYATGTDPIIIGRKGVIFVNMSTTKMEKVDISLEIDGKPVELNERHDTSRPIETTLEQSGRVIAYQFDSPDPNGYPIGTWDTTEMIIRDRQGKTISRYAFTLIIKSPLEGGK